jgi:ketosteroid isomerase-like protein
MVEQQATDILRPFLDQLSEALSAVANGDPEPMKAMCSHTDSVSQCGFWGGVESGWAEVGERWEWVASQFVPGQGEVTSETAFLTESGDMAYGVFIERWRGRFKGRLEPTELMIRATLIFRREDDEWKAVHRHGDNAVEKVPPS